MMHSSIFQLPREVTLSKDHDLRYVLPCEFAGMMMGEFQSRFNVCFDFFVASCDCGDGSSIFLGSHEYSSYCFSACGEVQLVPRAVERTYLVPNLVLRGPFPLNGVQLVPSRMVEGDMKTFADMMNAALVRLDALSKIS